MSNKNHNYDIHERIFNFIVIVLKFIENIPKSQSNQVIINQITRSVTSIGANSQEADGAMTTKDFLHCFTIVRKESKETVFWLRLTEKTNPSISVEANKIIQEGKEIVAIVSTIIKNTKSSHKN